MTSPPATVYAQRYYDAASRHSTTLPSCTPDTTYYTQQSNFLQPTLCWFVGIKFPHQGLNQGCVSKSAKS